MKKIFPLFLILLLCACNKDEEDSPIPGTTELSCSTTNTGDFNITIDGANHVMAFNDQSHFSILYNWYTEGASDFIFNSLSQNNEDMSIEFS